MRKSPLGLVVLILLLFVGAGLAVYFMLGDDAPVPMPRPQVADIDAANTPRADAPELPAANQPAPEPDPQPEPEIQPMPEPKPTPQPEEKPLTGPEAHGFPKPTRAVFSGPDPKQAVETIAFGTVIDQDRQPLNGAHVVAHVVRTSGIGGHTLEAVPTVTTGKDGRFSIALLHGAREGEEIEIVVSARKNDYCLSSVLAPQSGSPIELQLHAFSNDTTIEGEVVDGDNVVAAGARVFCTGSLALLDPDSVRLLSPYVQEALSGSAAQPWNGAATTDEFGRFTIKRLPPGAFKVWTGRQDQPGQSVEIEVLSGRSNLLPQALVVPK